eukprot:TRINITY_DN4363_c0_g1_i3.p1 TRINITY_DN4363_c0_g1~~TRINITY_DN4363_c0_g1_i3.p1  ORF type:complete len:323 (-),score=42.90 TRINITY_DN4363_c0_g1_i3:74-1042(-)
MSTYCSSSDFVSKTLVKDVIRTQGDVISVESDSLLSGVFQKLLENRISSAPVYNKSENRFANFVDVQDFCNYVSHILDTVGVEKAEESLLESSCSVLEEFRNLHSNWAGKFVDNLYQTDSLRRAINVMVSLVNVHRYKSYKRPRLFLFMLYSSFRLPVFTLSGDLVGILSQMDIVSLLDTHIQLFPIANKSVKDLRLGLKEVIQISDSLTLKDAFRVIRENRVSGIAVVDKRGYLVGNVSASDIKIIGKNFENLNLLEDPVSVWLSNTVTRSKPVSVSLTTTVQNVIRTMKVEKVHRVFVTDPSLVGVISPIDLLELVATHI